MNFRFSLVNHFVISFGPTEHRQEEVSELPDNLVRPGAVAGEQCRGLGVGNLAS